MHQVIVEMRPAASFREARTPVCGTSSVDAVVRVGDGDGKTLCAVLEFVQVPELDGGEFDCGKNATIAD